MSKIKVKLNFDGKSETHDDVICLYVEMGDKVYYFDNGTEEEILHTWEKDLEEA